MKFIILSLITTFIASSAFAETQSEFIKRTSSLISFEQRIKFPIINAYNRNKAFGIEGFRNGYACQDIGKAQLAIDLALHNKMVVKVIKSIHRDINGESKVVTESIDLDKLFEDLDKIQDEICRLYLNR